MFAFSVHSDHIYLPILPLLAQVFLQWSGQNAFCVTGFDDATKDSEAVMIKFGKKLLEVAEKISVRSFSMACIGNIYCQILDGNSESLCLRPIRVVLVLVCVCLLFALRLRYCWLLV